MRNIRSELEIMSDFDNWFNEIENFSLRSERLSTEIETKDRVRLIEWLKAAYKAGYEHGADSKTNT